MYKSEQHIYFIVNKLNQLFKDILKSHISQEELFQKAFVTCHEFAFYCLGEGLEQEKVSKNELIQGLIKAFASAGLFSSDAQQGTVNQEYLMLVISREFDEMKVEVTELLKHRGISKEEVLMRLLGRLGISEVESQEISKKIIHALQTLELPEPNGYYPTPESIKFATN